MASLSEPQQNSIRIAFQVLHQKMAELEGLFASGATPSPLSRYASDLAPTEVKVVRDDFSRIRAVMLADLKEEGIPLNVSRTSLRWAVTCGVSALSVMVDEMGPRTLANYGPLDAEGRARAERVQGDVRRLVEPLAAYSARARAATWPTGSPVWSTAPVERGRWQRWSVSSSAGGSSKSGPCST